MSTSRDPDRLIHSFLLEGEDELFDQVYDRVRAGIEQKRQRVVIGPWRMPTMNKIVGFGLAAAAVVVAIFVGAQFLGPPANTGGGIDASATPEPTASPTAEPTPSPSADAGLPEGPFVVENPTGEEDPVEGVPAITVTIPAPGWSYDSAFDLLQKGEDADPPEAAILLWGHAPGTDFYVYGDPCQWDSTRPDAPAATVDEIAAALAAQPSRDASEPVDVTIGGYAGKSLTLHVPDDASFSDCDEGNFASYGVPGDEPSRYHQGPGQVDELWILDVDGSIVILDAMYRPDTPAELIEELRAIAESSAFELP